MEDGRASGPASSGGFADYEADRWLGNFVTRRGVRYTLSVETHADAAALRPFAPRFVVQPSPSINQDEMVKTTLFWLAAGLVGAAGFTVFAAGLWLERRNRRVPAAAPADAPPPGRPHG
jgi:hypothetical protein